jgi:hypothetical protein
MDKDMDMDVVENMKTWTRTWKHGRGHGNMDEDRETWTRTWKEHRRKQTGNMDLQKIKSRINIYQKKIHLLQFGR